MPRHARIDRPGLLQHVIVRGVAHSDIFLDDRDREEFVERLEALLTDTNTVVTPGPCLTIISIYWSNPTKPPSTLATFMRHLLTGYAVAFKLRHNRVGHLFQNRYKSIVCDGEPYLLELVRYIHLNPVRAGKVKDLESLEIYPWSGHRQLLGKSARAFIHQDEILPYEPAPPSLTQT